MSDQVGPEPEQAGLPSIERLRAEGSVIEGTGGWADVELLPAAPDGPTISEVLRQTRDEERW